MEIETARNLKRKLEEEIKSTITFKLAEFQAATGLVLHGVNVELVDVTFVGSQLRLMSVSRVEIQTDI